MEYKPRLFAFYLPQYHPIPENDAWWGKGFTEWDNVRKARPMFKNHYQPRLPAELGYYDLRNPETRNAQAEMAREFGIEGFCYWHYWFGGKLLLERPFEEVLHTGKPDYPFCLAWANVSWTSEWAGRPDEILIKQEYPGMEDHRRHFEYLLPAFSDPRYILVDNRPLFYIHRPQHIPEIRRMIETWRELAHSAGLNGLYLVGGLTTEKQAGEFDLDGFSYHYPNWIALEARPKFQSELLQRIWLRYRKTRKLPAIYDYSRLMDGFEENFNPHEKHIPLIIPNWDNTPRVGERGVVFQNSNPEAFRSHTKKVLQNLNKKRPENRMAFIKSWNEWAEGNYLEPDQKFGKGYLKALLECLEEYSVTQESNLSPS